MLSFDLKVKGAGAERLFLNELRRKQLPFAHAKALTDTAKDVQAEILKDLPGKFDLKTNWYKPRNKFGFKIRAAKKNDLTAKVYTVAPWMEDHETGAIRKPQGRNLAIPSRAVKRTPKGLVRKSQKPRRLKKTFVKQTAGGPAIFQQVRKGVVRAMYWLEPHARIKPVLGFEKTAERVIQKVWKKNFDKAFDYAVRTAKRKR